MGLRKEQCAEWRKAPLLYCCNQVRMKVGGQIPWNVTPICETSQISHLMGRVYMKDVRKVMQRSVWNDIVSWQTGRFNNSTKFLLHASMTTTLKKKNEICWRIVTCMLSNCFEMLALGTDWTTWYSMVSEQTCTIHHKMDQGLWQTPESIDFINSSYLWIQTLLSCG